MDNRKYRWWVWDVAEDYESALASGYADTRDEAQNLALSAAASFLKEEAGWWSVLSENKIKQEIEAGRQTWDIAGYKTSRYGNNYREDHYAMEDGWHFVIGIENKKQLIT